MTKLSFIDNKLDVAKPAAGDCRGSADATKFTAIDQLHRWAWLIGMTFIVYSDRYATRQSCPWTVVKTLVQILKPFAILEIYRKMRLLKQFDKKKFDGKRCITSKFTTVDETELKSRVYNDAQMSTLPQNCLLFYFWDFHSLKNPSLFSISQYPGRGRSFLYTLECHSIVEHRSRT